MNLNRYTQKAQEAVVMAKDLAEDYSHQEIAIEHLAVALVEQQDGVVPRLLRLVQIDPEAIGGPLRQNLAAAPKLSGHQQVYMSRALDAADRKRVGCRRGVRSARECSLGTEWGNVEPTAFAARQRETKSKSCSEELARAERFSERALP